MTEEGRWTRDETPYLIFMCSKCKQYSYVKTTQKTKKCLRCGRTHQVMHILRKGEKVNGMTMAVERVKVLQNELARKELGKQPNLVSDQGFNIPRKESFVQASKLDESLEKESIEEFKDYYPEFITMLTKLSKTYKEFPLYLINIAAETDFVPQSLLPSLIERACREGMLQKKGDLYSLKSKEA